MARPGGWWWGYYAPMPKVSIYLPAELAKQVKAEKVPLSEVCQRALHAELAGRERDRQARQAVLWDRETPSRRQ